MKDKWIKETIGLKFLIGEIRLFTLTMPFLVLDGHFSDLSAEESEPNVPYEKFSPVLQGALLRSYPVRNRMPRLTWERHVIRYVPSQYEQYYIDMDQSFEDYLKKFSSKSRSTLKRKVRKFAESSGGELEYREYKEPFEMEEFHRLARLVSEKTYQEKILGAGLPTGSKFCDEMIGLAEQDRIRAFILFHDNRPISYLYVPIINGVLFYAYLGHDPEYKNLSPGTVLQYLALEKLFGEKRFRIFDFTTGEGQHKEFFSTNSQSCADIYYFKPSFRNGVMIVLHRCLQSLSATIVAIFDRLGIKKKIKRLIRSI